MKLSELINEESAAQWIDYNDEVSFKIKPLDNDNYQIAFEKYRRYVASQDFTKLNLDVDDSEQSEAQVQCHLFAKHIIEDWKGILDEDGKAVPFNSDIAYQMLKTNSDVFLALFKAANNLTAKNDEKREATKKKSQKSSNSNSSTGAKSQK